jgi:hypothetical protein
MLAPSPFLEAILRVLYCATLEARIMGWQGSERASFPESECRRLAALMDVVHNLPHLLQRWETVDEPRLRRSFREHDEKWKAVSTFSLLAEYESLLHHG